MFLLWGCLVLCCWCCFSMRLCGFCLVVDICLFCLFFWCLVFGGFVCIVLLVLGVLLRLLCDCFL